MAKHKHYDLIVWWASDPENNIVEHFSSTGVWEKCIDNKPWWESSVEYRKKPTIVKRWKWAYNFINDGDHVYVTEVRYTENEFNKNWPKDIKWKSKIIETEKEFTE